MVGAWGGGGLRATPRRCGPRHPSSRSKPSLAEALQPDTSILRKTGHFYFALTGSGLQLTQGSMWDRLKVVVRQPTGWESSDQRRPLKEVSCGRQAEEL